MLAFSLGLLHAFDADHIMAVTTLSVKRPTIKHSMSFCRSWAIGHGVALLVISSVVLLIGQAIALSVSHIAEQLVGVVLIVIGLWVLGDTLCSRKQTHIQQIENNRSHEHTPHEHTRSATLVGLLHGTAGSAPLLALLPMSKLVSPWLVLSYILLFGLGVLVAMLLFGGLLSRLFQFAANRGKQVISGIRLVIALGSVAYGLFLLLQGASA